MLIVFDLDGTLIDTLEDLAAAVSLLVVEYGGSPIEPVRVARMVGEGAAVLVERAISSAGITVAPPGALERFTGLYAQVMFDHTAAYPGVPELLDRLAPCHDLALLTNKPAGPAEATLAYCGIAGHFACRVFGDGRLARKPDPEGLQWLMERHRASAGATLMVGDSLVDLETARGAGARVCLARYGFGFGGIPADALRGDELFADRALDLLDIVEMSTADRPT